MSAFIPVILDGLLIFWMGPLIFFLATYIWYPRKSIGSFSMFVLLCVAWPLTLLIGHYIENRRRS